MEIKNSQKIFEKAKEVIPGATQTLSKSYTQFIEGVSPLFLEKGEGCHVWDVDGNKYIDYILALGPITLGYNNKEVNEAIKKQLEKGISFSLPNSLEVELSCMLKEIIPCAEMVRFSKNGTDVTTAAVRVARSYTGKEKIAYCGYHGGSSHWWGITTPLNNGIPKIFKDYIIKFEYNNIESLKEIFEKNEIAAVIMEPTCVTEPKEGFLEEVKELTHKNKALLIFDEMVTGFRISMGGAQEFFKVTPDLATFGKGVANGMPLSFLAGKKEYMKELGKIFFSMTYSGETLSLAAAIATIKEMKKNKVIEHMWKQGTLLKQGYNDLAKKYGIETKCLGYAPKTYFGFYEKSEESLGLKSLFLQETVKRGILCNCVNHISLSTSEEDIKKTLIAIEEAFKIMKNAVDENNFEKYMEGKPVQHVFRKH
jgi:glutamate-1-semialdehyde-2,1-aminomutase